jgi:hypothetical protein
MIITAALSYGFYKHIQEILKDVAEGAFKQSALHKTEAHISAASHWATRQLMPPLIVNTYRKIPPRAKSLTAASLLGVAFFERLCNFPLKFS